MIMPRGTERLERWDHNYMCIIKEFSRYRGCPLYTKVRPRQGRYNFYEERKCITIKVTSTLSYFTMHSFLAFEFTVFSNGVTS